MVLVDANVLLDLVTAPNAWSDWSTSGAAAGRRGGSVARQRRRFRRRYRSASCAWRTAEEVFTKAEVALAPMPRRALFRAGKAFRRVSPPRRDPHRRAAGLLHRRPCRSRGAAPPDARRQPLPQLLPRSRSDRPVLNPCRPPLPRANAPRHAPLRPATRPRHARPHRRGAAPPPARGGRRRAAFPPFTASRNGRRPSSRTRASSAAASATPRTSCPRRCTPSPTAAATA